VPDIKKAEVKKGDNTVLYLTLPAGSEKNLNPELLINAFYSKNADAYYCYTVHRTAILDKDGKDFK
jgi:hypothetical protein